MRAMALAGAPRRRGHKRAAPPMLASDAGTNVLGPPFEQLFDTRFDDRPPRRGACLQRASLAAGSMMTSALPPTQPSCCPLRQGCGTGRTRCAPGWNSTSSTIVTAVEMASSRISQRRRADSGR